jgi:hypothetical protein
MKTKLLILVALGLLILPVGSFIVIFAPFYVSMWMALYFLYDPKQPGAANPFENALWDFSVVWEQYGRVFSHWMNTPVGGRADGQRADGLVGLSLPARLLRCG